MVETPTTANRGYQQPSVNNTPSEDVLRLIAALDAIDLDVAQILGDLANKASAGHTHTIAEITNLATTLAAKAEAIHNHALAALSDVDISGAPADRPLVTTAGGTIGFGPAIATAAAQLAIAAITGMSAENVQAALEELAAGKVPLVDGLGVLGGLVNPGYGIKIKPSVTDVNLLEFLDDQDRRRALLGLFNQGQILLRIYNELGGFRPGLVMYPSGSVTLDGFTIFDNSARAAADLAPTVEATTHPADDSSSQVATTRFVHNVADHVLWVRDEQVLATPGGDASAANTWEARVINTIEANNIAGSSLSANQISLPAGTYLVSAVAPVHRSGFAKLRLYDVTADVPLIESATVNASNSTYDEVPQHLQGRFTLTVASVIELQQIVSSIPGNNQGLGLTTSIGAASIFADMLIRKV